MTSEECDTKSPWNRYKAYFSYPDSWIVPSVPEIKKWNTIREIIHKHYLDPTAEKLTFKAIHDKLKRYESHGPDGVPFRPFAGCTPINTGKALISLAAFHRIDKDGKVWQDSPCIKIQEELGRPGRSRMSRIKSRRYVLKG